jgi:hypothetical protein
VYVIGGTVHVDNVVISDPAVVQSIAQSDDPVAELQRIVGIGARVGKIGETTAGAIDLATSVERFTTTVGDTVGQAVDDLAAAAGGLLDGEEGRLPKAFAGFRREIESMLGDNFDPDSKKSIVGKFESMLKDAADEQTKRLNRALDPHDPDSLVGRLRDDVVKTVKDETSEVARQVTDLREIVVAASASERASKSMFDKTVLKGISFEDVLHDKINAEAVRYGDLAMQVRREAGASGTQDGDELVCLNPDDTRGAVVNVVWEAKTGRLGIKKALDELGSSMVNRLAGVGIIVFGNPATAPIKVPFAQYGDKAVLVVDKEDPDNGAIQLAYMWARWVARRQQSDGDVGIDVARVETLVADATRSLENVKQVRTCHTKARKSIDDAGTHLDTLTREIHSALSDLRVEIEKTG